MTKLAFLCMHTDAGEGKNKEQHNNRGIKTIRGKWKGLSAATRKNTRHIETLYAILTIFMGFLSLVENSRK